MHSLVLRLKRKDVLRALAPCLARVGIDMRKHVRNALLKVPDCLAVGVEVARAVPLAVEIALALERIVAVQRDQQLDAVLVRLHHDLIQALQDRVVPSRGLVALQSRERVNLCAFCVARLA